MSIAPLAGEETASTGYLRLGDNHRFVLKEESESHHRRRSGTFTIRGSTLVLEFSRGRPILGHWAPERNDLGEYHYRTAAAQPTAPVDITGTWTVRTNGREEKSCRMTFSNRGEFFFTGRGATSRGTYSLNGDEIRLSWTEIDGEPVQDGPVEKTVYFEDDGRSFSIDSFRYELAGN